MSLHSLLGRDSKQPRILGFERGMLGCVDCIELILAKGVQDYTTWAVVVRDGRSLCEFHAFPTQRDKVSE